MDNRGQVGDGGSDNGDSDHSGAHGDGRRCVGCGTSGVALPAAGWRGGGCCGPLACDLEQLRAQLEGYRRRGKTSRSFCAWSDKHLFVWVRILLNVNTKI